MLNMYQKDLRLSRTQMETFMYRHKTQNFELILTFIRGPSVLRCLIKKKPMSEGR